MTRSAKSPPAPAAPPAGGSRFARPCLLAARVGLALAAAVLLLSSGPLVVLAFGGIDLDAHWSSASRASTGLAPLPAAEPAAVVQVYGARAFNWRGTFGLHTWIATEREGADHYTVHHVLGWNLRRGGSVVTTMQAGPPDFHWFNARPGVLAEHRGAGVEALIDRIEAAVAQYPHADRYNAWPGPNSNTFVAWVAREVPELRLDLLGLNAGIDFDDAALRLPGLGRVGPGRLGLDGT